MSSAIGWGALAVTTIGSVAGGAIAAKGSKDAAKTAAAAQQEGADTIYRQFKETEANLKPFVTGEGGPASFQRQQALSGAKGPEAQQEAYDQYVESPGVAFLRERGMRGIEQNAARPGGTGIYSGNTLKALSQFNQGLALQDFNNYYNRLGSLTGISLNAAQAIGGVGGQAAAGQASLTSGAGQELAAGQIGATRSYASAFTDLSNTLGQAFASNRGNNTGYLSQPQGSIPQNIHRTA